LAGDAILVKEKIGFMESDGAMAGPAISLMGCLKATLKKTDFTLEQAVKCATKNPAKAVGIFQEQGSLSVGKLANLILLDDELNIQQIIYKGKWLNQSRGE
jgi:N-acetylglucosamine-6-phosphate deacetylase